MNIVGKTKEGHIVVAGLGKLYFENGIPFSLIFDECQKRKLLPSWFHLRDELKSNGMKEDRIVHLLSEQVFESYGKEFRDVVIDRIIKK